MATSELEGRRIGFIGCGAMARALAGGLAEAGVPAAKILGSDPFEAARDQFEDAVGATTTAISAAAETAVLESSVVRDLAPEIRRQFGGKAKG